MSFPPSRRQRMEGSRVASPEKRVLGSLRLPDVKPPCSTLAGNYGFRPFLLPFNPAGDLWGTCPARFRSAFHKDSASRLPWSRAKLATSKPVAGLQAAGRPVSSNLTPSANRRDIFL